MHHEKGTGAPMGLVECVGKAEIEGAVHDAVWIELLGGDRVEALGRLAVALPELRPEPARPQADGIGGEALEAALLLDPKLELRFKLEDANVDGRRRA